MTGITTKDSAEIYYKNWGTGQFVVFGAAWRIPTGSSPREAGKPVRQLVYSEQSTQLGSAFIASTDDQIGNY